MARNHVNDVPVRAGSLMIPDLNVAVYDLPKQ